MNCFKIEKGVYQDCILLIAYLTSIQSISCKIPGSMNHQLELRFWEKYQQLRYADDTSLTAENRKGLKNLLIKEGSENVGLKLSTQKMIMGSSSTTSWQRDGETMETVADFIVWGSKNHCRQ